MGCSLLLLSRYERKGPSSRVRHYNYLPALREAGFDVTVAPLLTDAYLDSLFRGERAGVGMLLKCYARRLRHLIDARRYDLIWVEKEALPWLPARIERAFFGDRPVIIDYDDPWFIRYAGHPNVLVRALLGHKMEALVAQAEAVTAGSRVIADWARAAPARRVVEMPSVVDTALYPVEPLPTEGPFTIGWIGTLKNEPFLQLIAEPLRQLTARFGARLRVIGGSGRFDLPGVAIDRVAWSEATEVQELARCHVGVMPLTDGDWERGKCGYKLVQYMAAGRAAVASPVGPNATIVVHGKTGFVAATAEEWVTALAELATDRARAQAMGQAARRRIEGSYSLDAMAPRLVELLNSALLPGARRRIASDLELVAK